MYINSILINITQVKDSQNTKSPRVYGGMEWSTYFNEQIQKMKRKRTKCQDDT